MNEPSTAPQRASQTLPAKWVEEIFKRLHGRFGNVFLAKWACGQLNAAGEDIGVVNAKTVWGSELRGYTPDELKRGLSAKFDYPPGCDEFQAACRPVADIRALWGEACEQMRIRLQGRQEDRWSSPRVYWAAIAIGAHDLNLLGWEQIRARWETALAQARDDEIPEYRAALPAPGNTKLSRDEARARLAELRTRMGLAPVDESGRGNKDWALRLLDREYRGERLQPIQTQMAREALGFESGLAIEEVMSNLGKIQQEAA